MKEVNLRNRIRERLKNELGNSIVFEERSGFFFIKNKILYKLEMFEKDEDISLTERILETSMRKNSITNKKIQELLDTYNAKLPNRIVQVLIREEEWKDEFIKIIVEEITEKLEKNATTQYRQNGGLHIRLQNDIHIYHHAIISKSHDKIYKAEDIRKGVTFSPRDITNIEQELKSIRPHSNKTERDFIDKALIRAQEWKD